VGRILAVVHLIQQPFDLLFAQGYTQAQDRWWQMEFFRHIGSGSIEELTGKNPELPPAPPR